MAQNFNSSTAFWWQGDFNYDGVVNALDFNILASNFGQVMSSEALGTLVPEPMALGMLGLGFILLCRRRLRRLRCCSTALPARAACVLTRFAKRISNRASETNWELSLARLFIRPSPNVATARTGLKPVLQNYFTSRNAPLQCV